MLKKLFFINKPIDIFIFVCYSNTELENYLTSQKNLINLLTK